MSNFAAESIPDRLLAPYLDRIAVRTGALYWAALAMTLTLFVMMPFVTISLTVQARGIVRPVREKAEIRSAQTEMVSRILVEEGQEVKKGDTLLLFRADRLNSQWHFLRSELERTNRYVSDLTCMTSQSGGKPSTGLYLQQYTSFERNVAELDTKIFQAGIEEQRNKYLVEKEIIPSQVYEGKVYERQMLEEEKGIAISDRMAQWKAVLSDLLAEKDELQRQLDQAMHELQQLAVLAPVTGTLEEFQGIYEGSVLQSGETIAVISPRSEMIAEVILSARDVGLLNDGQRAKLQVDAFNHHQWGSLEGTVFSISDDYVLVDNVPAFVVKCRLDRNYLELPAGIRGYLRKGMTVHAYFVTARCSLLQLLLQRFDKWFNPSGQPDR